MDRVIHPLNVQEVLFTALLPICPIHPTPEEFWSLSQMTRVIVACSKIKLLLVISQCDNLTKFLSLTKVV